MRLLVQSAPRELDLTEKKYQVKAAQGIWVFWRQSEKKPAQYKRDIREQAWDTDARGGWEITLGR